MSSLEGCEGNISKLIFMLTILYKVPILFLIYAKHGECSVLLRHRAQVAGVPKCNTLVGSTLPPGIEVLWTRPYLLPF